ncbi:MAG: MurT ligase domain-containing protein [Coriobacteriales bacterium]|jgi:UDP-N-acetylmuramyl tripeptide synthase|nr:MurT ligase domain-containing protein [Coriobacteriales bacterium]
MRIRFMLALWLAKACACTLRLLKRGGTQLPGRIALALCPAFLSQIGLPPLVIAVTGTNGKTTVANIVVDVYEHLGFRVASNRQGSNLNAGVAAALLTDAGLGGQARAQVAVLEIDERSSRLIYPFVAVDILVCTNLFRDSVGRNGHAEYIAFLIDSALPLQARLVLNADDLISAQLGLPGGAGAAQGTGTARAGNERRFYGVAPLPGEVQRTDSLSRDIAICPVCSTALHYSFVRYHHIGRAVCPNCGFHSPEADYLATGIDPLAATLSVQMPAGPATFRLLNDSVFNIYNQMAALAALREAGLDVEQLTSAFSAIKLTESRYHAEECGSVRLVMQLAKGQNAIACSRAFDYIAQQPGRKALVLNLDDHFDAQGGSENITWLYDCDYEYLNDPHIAQLVIGGVRSHDHYLRLRIAGVPPERMVRTRHERDTADLVDLENIDAVYILYDVYTVDTAKAVRSRLQARLQARLTERGGAQ